MSKWDWLASDPSSRKGRRAIRVRQLDKNTVSEVTDKYRLINVEGFCPRFFTFFRFDFTSLP